MKIDKVNDINIHKMLSPLTKQTHLKNNHNSNNNINTKMDMLEIPEILQTASSIYSMPKVQRTRKHRLLEQKNTQIERSNRILYEKIRKIMIKGRNSQKSILIQGKQEESQLTSKSVNKQQKKPLHLPAISERSKSFSLRSINAEVQNIPVVHEKKSTIHEKYLSFISKQRIAQQILTDREQLGNYKYNGWHIKVELINNREYLLINGYKDKEQKQIIKKYKYHKIIHKIQGNLQQWVISKFQYEV